MCLKTLISSLPFPSHLSDRAAATRNSRGHRGSQQAGVTSCGYACASGPRALLARELRGPAVAPPDGLARRPQWRARGGRDHFMVAGRTAWDFRRYEDVDEQWGTKLLHNPAVQNMTVLVLETSPWRRDNLAVPYPTYFHPEAAADVAAWLDTMLNREGREEYLSTCVCVWLYT